MTMTFWWSRWGASIYQILTGVTSDVNELWTHLVYDIGKIEIGSCDPISSDSTAATIVSLQVWWLYQWPDCGFACAAMYVYALLFVDAEACGLVQRASHLGDHIRRVTGARCDPHHSVQHDTYEGKTQGGSHPGMVGCQEFIRAGGRDHMWGEW